MMITICTYEPEVCPNKTCLGYGDTVPAEHGKCFICHTPMEHYSKIPYDDLDSFVKKTLEHMGVHPL